MVNRVLKACAVAAALLSAVGTTQGAMVTIAGTDFDLRYDDARLGLFGTPTLLGNQIFFTFNNFAVDSVNGEGLQELASTLGGMELLARAGLRFGAVSMSEFGDYNLAGAGSRVEVNGRLQAFDLHAPSSSVSAALVLNGLTPLDLDDGLNHDWLAGAQLDTASLGTSSLGLSIENRLEAYTDAAAGGLRQAFIEKKFAGVAVDVSTFAVPEPGTLAGVTTALVLLATLLDRRRR